MKKLLLLLFILFIGQWSYGQIKEPFWIGAEDKAEKTSLWVILQAKDTLALEFEVEISGPGITGVKTFKEPVGDIQTNFQIPGLLPNSTYTVRFRAIGVCPDDDDDDDDLVITSLVDDDAEDETCESEWVTKYVKTKMDFPKKPTVQLENNCPKFVGINWSFSEQGGDVTYVEIKKGHGTGVYTTTASLPPYETTFYDLATSPGIYTEYMVIAYNENNEQSVSNLVGITVTPFVAPGAPMNLQVNKEGTTNHSLSIIWENAAEDYGCGTNLRETYYIFTRSPGEENWEQHAWWPQAHTYEIENLGENEVVEIMMVAVSDQGIWSNPVFLTGKTYGPSLAPSNLIGVGFINKLGDSGLGISWQHDESDADYYVLEYSVDGGNTFIQLAQVFSSEKLVYHLNISEGLPYTYRVKAGNYLYGESDWTYMNGTVQHEYTQSPKAPYALRASWSGNNVDLKWVDDSNKEENYIIERSDSEDGDFTVIGQVQKNVTNFTDAGAAELNSNLYYRVYAENPIGQSSYSNVARVKIADAGSDGENPAPVIGVLAYPNPTVDKLNISIPSDFSSEKVSVKVYNQLNQLVLNRTFDSEAEIELNFKRLVPGLYNVVVESGNKKETKKIIKN